MWGDQGAGGRGGEEIGVAGEFGGGCVVIGDRSGFFSIVWD